jgi:uncharacterized protein (TIGR02246 family)
MRSTPCLLSLVILSGCLSPGIAATEDDVAAATQAWAAAYDGRDPAQVLALYAPDAVLWGTVSPILRDTPALIRDYFKSMPERPHARVTIGEHRVRVFGNIAINTGYYTFTNVRADGTTETNPSRFSFTYRLRDGKWWIVDHHSSRVPPTP